jgi:hypothetical protein
MTFGKYNQFALSWHKSEVQKAWVAPSPGEEGFERLSFSRNENG